MAEVSPDQMDLEYYTNAQLEHIAATGEKSPILENYIAKLTARAMVAGDPDPGAAALSMPKLEDEIFFCPLCGVAMKLGETYYECKTHGKFDISIGNHTLTVEMVRER